MCRWILWIQAPTRSYLEAVPGAPGGPEPEHEVGHQYAHEPYQAACCIGKGGLLSIPEQAVCPFWKPWRSHGSSRAAARIISKVGIFLAKDLFSHGQLYGAMSRVEARCRIFLQVLGGSREGLEGVYTRNIVYREALL